uniref:Uncharacterized protein n=2 Tax=Rhizophagus irregularis TaxID=588596 RepID=U9TPI8_RHIID
MHSGQILNQRHPVRQIIVEMIDGGEMEINLIRTNRGRIAKPERKANKYLNRVNHDEDELLHYPLEEYNSEYDSRNIIGRHEAQHAVSNIYGVQLEDYSFGGEFNPDQKSDMHNKIETIEEINNAANHMIQNEMAQLSIPHEDKSIISNYQVLFKFVKDNNFEIVSNKYKENYSSAITDFRENITDQQKKIYDDTVELLKSKSDENPYLRFRSESDIDLILGNETIELCTNQRHFTKIQNQMT